jgi:hypothetical protein
VKVIIVILLNGFPLFIRLSYFLRLLCFKKRRRKRNFKNGRRDVPILKLLSDEEVENFSDCGNRDNEGSPTPLHSHNNKCDPDEIIRRSVSSESVSAICLK